MSVSVRERLVDDGGIYGNQFSIQNWLADQRKIGAADQQDLFEVQLVSDIRWPITLNYQKVRLSDFELFSTNMHNGE